MVLELPFLVHLTLGSLKSIALVDHIEWVFVQGFGEDEDLIFGCLRMRWMWQEEIQKMMKGRERMNLLESGC